MTFTCSQLQSSEYSRRKLFHHLGGLVVILAGLCQAQAQTRLVSSVPANGASGVSVSAPVVFTFSDSMDPDFTEASFFSVTPFAPCPVTPSWNVPRTMMTCVPTPDFPANTMIAWSIQGVDELGLDVSGGGIFTTGSGGGAGSGTNRLTSFSVAKVHYYSQDSSGPPVLDPDTPFMFSANTSLASNRTATTISLQLPGGASANLTQVFGRPEAWYYVSFTNNLTALEGTYPNGDYQFTILSSQSNQSVTVNLAAGMTQPNAPHLTNYQAAQTVNASQPFTLGWDAFTGGTGNDYIYVTVGDAWRTPEPFAAGALPGTARSVTVPAGILQPNTNYLVQVGFYRASWTSNATYTTASSRSTITEATLTTLGNTAPPPVVTNAVLFADRFSFDVSTAAGQDLTVISTTDLSVPVAQWPVLLVTNSPGPMVRIVDPRPVTAGAVFYRVRNGF